MGVVVCREKSTILVHSFGTNSLMDWDDDEPGSRRPSGMFWRSVEDGFSPMSICDPDVLLY